MKRALIAALATQLVGCAALTEWASANQEAIEAGGKTVGTMVSTFLGLPPGVGEAIGGAATLGILGMLQAKKSNPA